MRASRNPKINPAQRMTGVFIRLGASTEFSGDDFIRTDYRSDACDLNKYIFRKSADSVNVEAR